ncbi:thioesterase family protein [Paracoccaceae bacterium]|nr:thioesterase family protein [Paracoccaceae bacterium]
MNINDTTEEALDSPYRTRKQVVLSDWIDYNGHMNVAYYTLAFDKALDFFFEDVLNIGPSFVEKNQEGPFALKASYNYFSELLEGENFFVDLSILDFDFKRVHVFGEMRKDESQELSAVFETVLMNMDLTERKVKQYPDRVLELFKLFKLSLKEDKIPTEIGKKITLKK